MLNALIYRPGEGDAESTLVNAVCQHTLVNISSDDDNDNDNDDNVERSSTTVVSTLCPILCWIKIAIVSPPIDQSVPTSLLFYTDNLA